MAAHAYLKNEFTKDKKCQNLMSWLKFNFVFVRLHLRCKFGRIRLYQFTIFILCRRRVVSGIVLRKQYRLINLNYIHLNGTTLDCFLAAAARVLSVADRIYLPSDPDNLSYESSSILLFYG